MVDKLTDSFAVASLTDPQKSYRIDVSMNTCTCPAWKYQRKPVPERSCKHLSPYRVQYERLKQGDRKRGEGRGIATYPKSPYRVQYERLKQGHGKRGEGKGIVTYPKTKVVNRFQLLANAPPKSCAKVLGGGDFVFCEKYDGVRISLRGHTATTRGGIQIDLSSLRLPFVARGDNGTAPVEFDCELITRQRPTSHLAVMGLINRGIVEGLTVRIFDIMDKGDSPFGERLQELTRRVGPHYVVIYFILRNVEMLHRALDDVQGRLKGEGLVVRNLYGYYLRGRQSAHNAFKLKRGSALPLAKLTKL